MSKAKIKIKYGKLAAVVAVVFAVSIGVASYSLIPSVAAGDASLFLQPSSGTYSVNDTFVVEVRVNTGGDSVNAVQADLAYSSSKLQFQSLGFSGSAFNTAGPSSGGSGSVSIVRGSIDDVNGTALVAKITFKVLNKGAATVSFRDSSIVVRTSDTNNVLGSTSGGNYTLEPVSTPPDSQPPGSDPDTTDSNPPPSTDSGSNPGNSNGNSSDDPETGPKPNDETNPDSSDDPDSDDTPTPAAPGTDSPGTPSDTVNASSIGLIVTVVAGTLAVLGTVTALILRKRGMLHFGSKRRQANNFVSILPPSQGVNPPEVFSEKPPGEDQSKY